MDEIILQNKDGKILANSKEVAERFGKQHKNILRNIKNLSKDMLNFEQMFIQGSLPDNYGREQKVYFMNRDGFSLLCMGFTGKKALEWKLKYIEAFNRMEETIKAGTYLSKEERLKLQLFSKDPLEVVSAHNKLVEYATAPLIKENEELKPKAEFHDAISVAENCINFGKFAATFQNQNDFCFGRNKIMEWCRENNYLCSSHNLKNKPSQTMINDGYMQYKENVNERNGKQYISYTPLLTGKGQIWLTKKLNEFLSK